MFERIKSSVGWNSGRSTQQAFAKIDKNFQALENPSVRDTAAVTAPIALNDKVIRATKGDGAQTIQIPTNASAAIPIGSIVEIIANTAQVVTIAAAGGVTLRKLATKQAVIAGQYGVARLRKVATNEWVLSGDLAAV